MTRLLTSIFLVSTTIPSVLGQDSETIDVANIFTWATAEVPDWSAGGLYALLGLVGALVTVFGLVGGAVPGTAGFARIDAGTKRVEEREKILDSMIKSGKGSEEITAVEVATNNLRDDLRDDRRRQFAVAAGLYAVLGAFFAAMLARDLLQALVIGAGWTAYLGALGLKRDYQERKTIKDEASAKLESSLAEAEAGTLKPGAFADLRSQAKVARSL